MRKSEAARLRPGDRIRFGYSMRTQDVDQYRPGWQVGTVFAVTPRGGVRVENENGKEWVPYHHILKREDG